MSHPRRIVVASALALGLALPRIATAQTTPQNQAIAQSLYDEAKKLMAASRWPDACPKLEESQRLDPTPVTEFYLADCYERAGRTASAWTTFLDLAATEHRNGGSRAGDRERVARDRAKGLEPRLTRLVIDVPAPARVSGLVVKRDGEVTGEGQWGTQEVVDPGKHTLEASAPGKQTWTTTEDIRGAGTSTTVRVEVLLDVPADVPAPRAASPALPANVPESPPSTSTPSSPLKTAGLVVGGVGVAGLVVGSIFGAIAVSKNSSANSGQCGGAGRGPNQCSVVGATLRSEAVNAGNVSTVAFIAGGVLAAGGAALFLFAPSGHVQAVPAVGTRDAGFIVRGDF